MDAKLDTLDIEDVETSTLSAGGESRAHPPISIKTKINRTTSVDMRSGSYNAGDSRLDMRIDMEGLYGPDRDEAETDAERRAQADADKQWRAVIKKAIDGYQSREKGWQQPTCADLKFSPVKNTITLHGGDSGSLRATAIAKSDGQQSELDARLTDTENAIFEPTRAGGTVGELHLPQRHERSAARLEGASQGARDIQGRGGGGHLGAADSPAVQDQPDSRQLQRELHAGVQQRQAGPRHVDGEPAPSCVTRRTSRARWATTR